MTSIETIDINSMLEVEGKLANKVVQELLNHIAGKKGVPTLHDCAPLLRTSPRSLQRHLAKEGYCYDDLTLKVKKYTLCKLAQSGMPFGDISVAMGFKDRSSLRVFTLRNWNLNPRHIKKLLRSDIELYS